MHFAIIILAKMKSKPTHNGMFSSSASFSLRSICAHCNVLAKKKIKPAHSGVNVSGQILLLQYCGTCFQAVHVVYM